MDAIRRTGYLNSESDDAFCFPSEALVISALLELIIAGIGLDRGGPLVAGCQTLLAGRLHRSCTSDTGPHSWGTCCSHPARC